MKFYKIFILLGLVFAGCETGKKEVPQHIVKHTVYAIDSSSVKQKTILVKDTSYLETLFKKNNLIDIHDLDTSIHVSLKYADTSNFLKRDFYDGLQKAYFPCAVAIRMCNAQYFLKQLHPQYSLLIYDAARPLHVQKMMWDSLDMPPDLKFNYLAPPFNASLHNYGCAVDLTIVDLSTGKELDMGTGFDHFGKLSEPVYEWKFLESGELSNEAFENRKLLRKVMQKAKLNPIKSEWWHFNYCTKEFAAENFVLIK